MATNQSDDPDYAAMLDEGDEPDWAAMLEEGDVIPKKRGVRKSLYDDRTLQGWLKVPHIAARDCEVPMHDAVTDRPRNKGMVTVVGDLAMCRICYMNEVDKES